MCDGPDGMLAGLLRLCLGGLIDTVCSSNQQRQRSRAGAAIVQTGIRSKRGDETERQKTVQVQTKQANRVGSLSCRHLLLLSSLFPFSSVHDALLWEGNKQVQPEKDASLCLLAAAAGFGHREVARHQSARGARLLEALQPCNCNDQIKNVNVTGGIDVCLTYG